MCERTPTQLSSLDAASITGQTPAEVLARAAGTYSGEVRYAGAFVTHKNDGASAPVTVELTYAGGELRDIDAVLVQPCPHDGPCPCEDSLEIDVNLRISSDDGALDETLTVALTSTPNNLIGSALPSIYHPYDPDAAPGGLETTDLDVDASALRDVILTGTLDRGGAHIGLNAEVEVGDGVGFGPFAEVFAIRELTDAACSVIPGDACAAAGCATLQGRQIYGGCECGDPTPYCTAAAGVGPSTALWAQAVTDPYETYYTVLALDGAVEPLSDPWIPCSELPEVASCQCFDGANACP
ncbi:MAG: hypothetical protein KC486_12710 [Myxococcales bacterium]|nr:hypothetical protein [Myxococcales bacterium]